VRALARELAAHLGGDPSALAAKAGALERIASKVGDRTILLDVSRISHFFARDKLTYAAANGREYVVEATIAALEGRLDPRRFVRIHRATIVNAAFVQELHGWIDGGVLVRLKDEKKTELPVARDRVREFKQRLGI
jgi:two-component system LytT family response regulator